MSMRRILAPLAACLLCGCTLIPQYRRPALPVAAEYPTGAAFGAQTGAASPAANIGWKDFFADPIMQSLIELALQNNRDLVVAADNVLSAQATFRVRRASLFPTIDATAGADYEHLPPAAAGGFTERINAYSLSLGAASYELDVFGRLRSLAEQARQQYLSQSETREATEIGLIAQMATAYLSLLADREALAVSRQTAEAQQHSYDLRVLTLNQGSGTGLDVAQAESSLRTAEASLAQYTRQEAQDLDQIVLLAGTPLPPALQARMMAEQNLNAQPAFPALPAGLPADLLRQRPDIRAAEHTLLAANANIGAARAGLLPLRRTDRQRRYHRGHRRQPVRRRHRIVDVPAADQRADLRRRHQLRQSRHRQAAETYRNRQLRKSHTVGVSRRGQRPCRTHDL